jgi:acetyl-CoA carboxylase biotin carboxylase subunit
VAQGGRLAWTQVDVANNLRGHAIEARLYAEDPAKNFLPSPGVISELKLPEGPGVRSDCGFTSHSEVPRFYDPMIAKIAAWAPTREEAIARLSRALGETMARGITTNVDYLSRILALDAFRAGDYDTGLLSRSEAQLVPQAPREDGVPRALTQEEEIALAAAAIWQLESDERLALAGPGNGASKAPSAWATAGRLAALRR